ncbi:hypothetical protein [Sphingobacterium hungaricum]|uniref:Uncharacterized protein n=1 Tax=Sphingobacterium hungaricum TaxID=2082723 RepID=A0A928UVE2_9SPHI|nr:hypothetical protein [Sphingobacterium hungaricum]MBE8712236.1 hypothetical protein [Sphingobacterium hungaricum]
MNQHSQTHTIKFQLDDALFHQLITDPNLLINHDSFDTIQLSSFILNHIEDLDGAPELTDFRMDRWRFDSETKTGKFRLHFAINRRFCCSDQESCRTDYLDFSFSYANQNFEATANYFDWTVSA